MEIYLFEAINAFINLTKIVFINLPFVNVTHFYFMCPYQLVSSIHVSKLLHHDGKN